MFKRQCLFFLAALLLQACSSLAIVAPKTFGEKVAYAQSSIVAGFNTLADLRERGAISKEQGAKMFGELDKASTLIRIARDAAAVGNQAGADKRLADALQILTAVELEMKRTTP